MKIVLLDWNFHVKFDDCEKKNRGKNISSQLKTSWAQNFISSKLLLFSLGFTDTKNLTKTNQNEVQLANLLWKLLLIHIISTLGGFFPKQKRQYNFSPGSFQMHAILLQMVMKNSFYSNKKTIGNILYLNKWTKILCEHLRSYHEFLLGCSEKNKNRRKKTDVNSRLVFSFVLVWS